MIIMGKMDALLLRSKFRGSMLGVLMGDCLGSAYEGDETFTAGMKLVIQRSFDKLEGPHFKAPVIQFTDDSAMAYAVAESLIQQGGFDQKDTAKKFVKSFYKEPSRGYGAGVTTVFQKLRNNKFVDILGPAREQFNGEGSLGNGGAMRVAPVALFCYKNYDLMVDVARKQSQITHTHKTGVDGAILQAIAIHQSLLLDPKQKLDTCKFTDDLIEKMDKIEVDEEGLGLVDPSPYKTQLKLVRDLICEEGDGPHDEKVVHHLGNDISALHSVPTAIYCFLRAQRPIKDIQTENPLRRAIQFANICSVMKWSENDIRKLVSFYKKFPCLWKKDISAYADNVARHHAYRSIHEDLKIPGVTFTDVMMKIRETRRSYVNELKKVLTARAAGYKYEPIFSWFDLMHEFLHSYLDYNEFPELYENVDFSAERVDDSIYHSNYQELDIEKSLPLFVEENSFPQKNGQGFDRSHVTDTNTFYQHTVTPPSHKSSHLFPRVKYHSPLSLQIHIPRNMDSLKLSDYPSINNSPNALRPEVQFILSSDSLVSDRSSSTIVCAKRSNFTSTPVKNFAECGVQWEYSDNERSSPAFRNDLSVGKDTRDSAVQVEFDEHDIFTQAIASCLRTMDVETAFKAQNQIRKVVNDHRLRKPETICLGGDTDTIGSMAGAIAGAFYGEESIRQEVLNHCESSSEFRNLADRLFELTST